VINRIRTLKPQIVVFSAFWYFPDKDYAPSRLKPALVATVKQVFAAGVQRVIILGSSPNWSNDVPILLVNEVRYHSNAPVPHRLGRDLLIDHDDSFLKAAAKESGASYVPLIDKLCDSSSCLVTTGSGWQDILMYDATHFTQHGSVLVAPMLWPEIAPNRLMANRTLTATAPGS
jgi:hypothetical protein